MKWIGNGVVNIKGKDYGHGDDLPKGIDKQTLKGWKEKGLVGEVVQAVAVNSETAAFEKQIDILKAQNADINAATEKLKAKNAELIDDVELLTAEVEELKTELEKLKKDGKK